MNLETKERRNDTGLTDNEIFVILLGALAVKNGGAVEVTEDEFVTTGLTMNAFDIVHTEDSPNWTVKAKLMVVQ